jgi:hypothetical protein
VVLQVGAAAAAVPSWLHQKQQLGDCFVHLQLTSLLLLVVLVVVQGHLAAAAGPPAAAALQLTPLLLHPHHPLRSPHLQTLPVCLIPALTYAAPAASALFRPRRQAGCCSPSWLRLAREAAHAAAGREGKLSGWGHVLQMQNSGKKQGAKNFSPLRNDTPKHYIVPAATKAHVAVRGDDPAQPAQG